MDDKLAGEPRKLENAMKSSVMFVSAVVLGLGIAAAGWFVGEGFFKGRAADRFVTVKGVAERDVKADVALWPIRFVATNDELEAAQAEIKASHQRILAFLEKHGIDPAAADLQTLEVNDRLANPYQSGTMQSRYIVTQSLMVRTTEIEKVEAAGQALGDLVDQGVVLSSLGGTAGSPTYLFTALSEHKPEMIAEATAKARRAAEQFAADSGSRIGKIRRARQGVFVVLPRDPAPGIDEGSQLDKTLRVVSTIDYYLED
jgi:hypothetical protein